MRVRLLQFLGPDLWLALRKKLRLPFSVPIFACLSFSSGGFSYATTASEVRGFRSHWVFLPSTIKTLIKMGLRYERKTLAALQAYAVNSRVLASKFEIVRIANRTSVQRNAFNWWSHSKRRGKYLYQLHCSRHVREYVVEPFRLWSQAIQSHKRLLNVHCDLVSLTCARYAPYTALSLRTAAIANASQAFRSTHAFWLDNPYIPFLRLCGITRAFSLWKEVCSVMRFLGAKV